MNTRYRRLAMTVMVYGALVCGSLLLNVMPGKAVSDDDDDRDSRIQQGFALVQGLPLHLKGKNRALVGLGAYLVNGVGGCNDCHTNPPYPDGGDPTLGQPKKINVAAYLAGGAEFIPAHPGFHAIVARNLTPDKTGLPEGGASFQEFRSIMRTGVDPDHAHPEVREVPRRHAVAGLSGNDRSRPPRRLRIPQRHSLHRGRPRAAESQADRHSLPLTMRTRRA